MIGFSQRYGECCQIKVGVRDVANRRKVLGFLSHYLPFLPPFLPFSPPSFPCFLASPSFLFPFLPHFLSFHFSFLTAYVLRFSSALFAVRLSSPTPSFLFSSSFSPILPFFPSFPFPFSSCFPRHLLLIYLFLRHLPLRTPLPFLFPLALPLPIIFYSFLRHLPFLTTSLSSSLTPSTLSVLPHHSLCLFHSPPLSPPSPSKPRPSCTDV